MISSAYMKRVSVGEGEAVAASSCSEMPGATSCAHSAGDVSVMELYAGGGVLKRSSFLPKGVVMLDRVVLVYVANLQGARSVGSKMNKAVHLARFHNLHTNT